MSGLLSAFDALGTLFGGFGQVTLGPVVLTGIAVPETLPWGGEQALIVHKLPGGQRVVNAMGRDDMPLEWSGYLEGVEAESQAATLDGLRQSGQQITFAFSIFSWTAVVQKFTASYERSNWIPYSISLVVVADNAAKFSNPISSALDDITGDINTAAGFDLTGAVAQGVTTAQTAMQAVGAVFPGSAAYVTATSALGGAQALIQGGIAASGGTISGLAAGGASVPGILGTPSAPLAIAALTNGAAAAGSLANMVGASGFVSRAQVNLAGAGV